MLFLVSRNILYVDDYMSSAILGGKSIAIFDCESKEEVLKKLKEKFSLSHRGWNKVSKQFDISSLGEFVEI